MSTCKQTYNRGFVNILKEMTKGQELEKLRRKMRAETNLCACLCVCECVCVCTYVCVHLCICPCMYMCVCLHASVCMYVYVCVSSSTRRWRHNSPCHWKVSNEIFMQQFQDFIIPISLNKFIPRISASIFICANFISDINHLSCISLCVPHRL